MKTIQDIYKIGTGPSSSHTMGPAYVASMFKGENPDADRFEVLLYGSLSKTGRGHGTDRVVKQAFSPVETEVIFTDSDLEDMRHPNTLDLIVFGKTILVHSELKNVSTSY